MKRAERNKILAEATEVELRNAATERGLELHRTIADFLVEEFPTEPAPG